MRKCNVCDKEFDPCEINMFGVCERCVAVQLEENHTAIAYANSPEGQQELQELHDMLDRAIREQYPDFPI